MAKPSAAYEAGYQAGVTMVLRDWRRRSRLVLLAVWIAFCLPVGLWTMTMEADNIRYYIPLVLGTALLGYLYWIVDTDLMRKLTRFGDPKLPEPKPVAEAA
jgi:4-hydroxybenzoate polyprenyltransferase